LAKEYISLKLKLNYYDKKIGFSQEDCLAAIYPLLTCPSHLNDARLEVGTKNILSPSYNHHYHSVIYPNFLIMAQRPKPELRYSLYQEHLQGSLNQQKPYAEPCRLVH